MTEIFSTTQNTPLPLCREFPEKIPEPAHTTCFLNFCPMQIEHSEFQDQLVRGLAHRMNNILTLFHGYVGLLLDNKNLDRGTVDGLGRMARGPLVRLAHVDDHDIVPRAEVSGGLHVYVTRQAGQIDGCCWFCRRCGNRCRWGRFFCKCINTAQ